MAVRLLVGLLAAAGIVAAVTVSNKRSAEELAACPLSGCLLSLRVDVPGQAEHPYLP